MIDLDNPIALAAIGGLLIALSSTINLLFSGRITGMSGIFNSLITFDDTLYWKSSILSGLLLTSGVVSNLYTSKGLGQKDAFFDSPKEFNKGVNPLILIVAGFLVGLGTKLGNGCTSGHGVCGIPRLSPRSLVAVPTFMVTGAIIANLKYYVLPAYQQTEESYDNFKLLSNAAITASLLILTINIAKNKGGFRRIIDILISFIVGIVFALGLIVSGMVRKSKVEAFLTFNKNWDVSLMFVMGAAVIFNVISFNYIIHIVKKPIITQQLNIPSKNAIDRELIIGAAIFGLGWGLGGICPGPAMVVAPIYPYSMIKFLAGMAAGQYSGQFVQSKGLLRSEAVAVQKQKTK